MQMLPTENDIAGGGRGAQVHDIRKRMPHSNNKSGNDAIVGNRYESEKC